MSSRKWVIETAVGSGWEATATIEDEDGTVELETFDTKSEAEAELKYLLGPKAMGGLGYTRADFRIVPYDPAHHVMPNPPRRARRRATNPAGAPEAYVRTALWSSIDADGMPLDELGAELAPEAARVLARNAERFVSDNSLLIDEALENTPGKDMSDVWHDLWLTANGHGAGFWDGDWGDYGDRLTAAAKRIGETNLYVGDDGLIYA